MKKQFYRLQQTRINDDMEIDAVVCLIDNDFLITLDKGETWRSIRVERPEETIAEYAERVYDIPHGI